MRIIMLGTGHAVVTECYNTCWVLQNDTGEGLLVDGGGGVGLLTQMSHAGISWSSIREVFVTHKHIDHILGIVWMLRVMGMEVRRGSYRGTLRIYGNKETLGALRHIASELLWDVDNSLVGKQIELVEVRSGDACTLLGRPVSFFDVLAHDVSQLGFRMEYLPGHTLVCCGDVALKEANYELAKHADWLLHEASCLSDHPAASFIHRAGHSTVAEAARTAERVDACNLLLNHTEDGDLPHRRERYTAEAQTVYSGTVHVPLDLEVIEL